MVSDSQGVNLGEVVGKSKSGDHWNGLLREVTGAPSLPAVKARYLPSRYGITGHSKSPPT